MKKLVSLIFVFCSLLATNLLGDDEVQQECYAKDVNMTKPSSCLAYAELLDEKFKKEKEDLKQSITGTLPLLTGSLQSSYTQKKIEIYNKACYIDMDKGADVIKDMVQKGNNTELSAIGIACTRKAQLLLTKNTWSGRSSMDQIKNALSAACNNPVNQNDLLLFCQNGADLLARAVNTYHYTSQYTLTLYSDVIELYSQCADKKSATNTYCTQKMSEFSDRKEAMNRQLAESRQRIMPSPVALLK